MRRPSARGIITREYGMSRNFMTPTVIRCGDLGECFAYELSKGEGIPDPGQFKGPTIYGVSVVEYDPATGATTRRTDLSDVFRSQGLAQKHITDLAENPPETTLGEG
jgi:hypothetical protein